MHRCTFNGCWASSQSSLVGETWGIQNGAILTGACVLDNADVRMVVWTNSTMVNISSYCFWVTNAESFAVINSTFSNWGLAGSGYWAIITAPQSHLNFNITGNTFLSDSDFAGNGWRAINIQSGSYNKYVIANNIGYGLNGVGNLAGGGTVLDSGTAHFGKYVPLGGGLIPTVGGV
jgi:hypothetical protein